MLRVNKVNVTESGSACCHTSGFRARCMLQRSTWEEISDTSPHQNSKLPQWWSRPSGQKVDALYKHLRQALSMVWSFLRGAGERTWLIQAESSLWFGEGCWGLMVGLGHECMVLRQNPGLGCHVLMEHRGRATSSMEQDGRARSSVEQEDGAMSSVQWETGATSPAMHGGRTTSSSEHGRKEWQNKVLSGTGWQSDVLSGTGNQSNALSGRGGWSDVPSRVGKWNVLGQAWRQNHVLSRAIFVDSVGWTWLAVSDSDRNILTLRKL